MKAPKTNFGRIRHVAIAYITIEAVAPSTTMSINDAALTLVLASIAVSIANAAQRL